MTERERIARIESAIFGDGPDEPGALTRLATIQQMLQAHIEQTAMPTRATVLALVLGALVSAGVGMVSSGLQARPVASAH